MFNERLESVARSDTNHWDNFWRIVREIGVTLSEVGLHEQAMYMTYPKDSNFANNQHDTSR